MSRLNLVVLVKAILLMGVSQAARGESELRREIEAVVLDIAESGRGVRGPDNEPEASIKSDIRNWEPILAELMDEERYGFSVRNTAHAIALLRETSTHPEILTALDKVFRYRSNLLDPAPADPKELRMKRGVLRSLAAELVNTQSPELLSTVLDYMNSDQERESRHFSDFRYQDAYKAAGRWGNHGQVGVLNELAAFHREKGEGELAADAEAAVEAIKRRPVEKERRPNGGADQSDRRDREGEKRGGQAESEGFRGIWVGLATVVLMLALGVWLYSVRRNSS